MFVLLVILISLAADPPDDDTALEPITDPPTTTVRTDATAATGVAGGVVVDAGPLAVFGQVTGELGSGGEAVYRLTGVEGSFVISVVGVFGESEWFAPVLRVTDADGALVGEDAGRESFVAQVTVEVEPTDDLWVSVTEGGGAAGTFTIAVVPEP